MSPVLAQDLRRDGIDAVALPNWLGGSYRTASDEQILLAALSDERVLVTYDCRTIPSLLKEWAEVGQKHAGVILINQRTFRSNDFGGLLRALRAFVLTSSKENWRDRVVFLPAS